MSPNLVTQEEVDAVIRALRAEGVDPATAHRGQIRKAGNVGDRRARTIQSWIRLKGESPQQAAPSVAETREVTGDKQVITLPKTRIKTLEELIEYCEVDTDVWEVERFVVNKWEVGAKTEVGIHVEPLFQVKAWLRKRVVVAETMEIIKSLVEDARQHAPSYIPFKRLQASSGNMLEIGIPDLHVGKYAWAQETGHQDYDLRLSEEVFHKALEALVERTSGYNFDLINFVVGNDFFNYDNHAQTTTKGTPQSSDTRYPKMFRTGRRMIVDATDRLLQVAPVRLVVVPGNHDELSSFHLGENLSIWYHKHPQVEVDNTPTLRKYHEFGKVMLMWTHGDKEKKDDLGGIMASEQPQMWGRTAFREAHLGHLHKTRVEEKHGMRWRILSALCPADKWHADSGYVSNLRGAEGFIWNAEHGLLGTAVYTEVEANN
jgi:hypothetical protein